VTEDRPPRMPRFPRTPVPSHDDLEQRDPLGRMALFSDPEPEAPSDEHLFVECSTCLKETPVSPLDLVKAAFPLSLHLPLIRRYHSFMRCPACGRRTWVRVTYRT
jgi:hypothetical protein